MSLIDGSAFIKMVSVVLIKYKIVSFKDMLVDYFIKLLQAWAVWEEKTSTENMSPSDWPIDKSVTFSSLVINERGPSPLWVIHPVGR